LPASTRAALVAWLLGATPLAALAVSDAGYATVEHAFEATFIESGLGQRGYDENREYAAALYLMPDGRWYSTPVLAGSRTVSSIPYHLVPAEAVRIAGAHTHGQPRIPEDPTHVYGTDFSQADRRNAIQAFRTSGGRIDTQLLLTSQLVVLRMSIGLAYDEGSARIDVMARTVSLANPKMN
jgi:hypothetical protein